MLDRCDVRFWLFDVLRIWSGGLVGGTAFWGVLLLFLPNVERETLLDPAVFSLFAMVCTWLVAVMCIAGNVRYYFPLAVSFGTTRRSAWLATRLCPVLPHALTALLVLAVGLITDAGMTGASIVLMGALGVGWCSVLDFCVMLGMGRRGWDTAAKILTGMSTGCIGGFLSFTFIGSSTGALQTLVSFGWSAALVWVVTISLAVAVAANVGSALVTRRMTVRF